MIKLLENVYIINLEHRIDRYNRTIAELYKIGISSPKRFNAIREIDGALGCAKSHLALIELAISKSLEYICIVEDDIHFLDPEQSLRCLELFSNEYSNPKTWDFLFLSANNLKPYKIINNYLTQVFNCQCSSMYIVPNHYYTKLAQCFKKCIDFRLRHHYKNYTLDLYWKRYQQRGRWFIISPMLIVQNDDYSDIQSREVKYCEVMTLFNKDFAKHFSID
jgi:glycosyl transferase family 25